MDNTKSKIQVDRGSLVYFHCGPYIRYVLEQFNKNKFLKYNIFLDNKKVGHFTGQPAYRYVLTDF